MERKLVLGLATVLGLSILGNGYILLDSGDKLPVNLARGQIEVQGDAKSALATAVVVSGGTDKLTCKRGVIANHPDRVYCADGKRVGFLLDEQTAEDMADEVRSKLGEIVSDEATIIVEDGKVYVTALGAVLAK